jgi:predicted nucleic acid-binding protein
VIYLDTNLLLSLHVDDSNSRAAVEWVKQQTAPLAMSNWCIAEFRGNVALRLRKKEIPPRQAERILDTFDTQFSAGMVTLPVTDGAHRQAARWLREAACSLQPPDALHLAIAVENDAAAFATFDHRFAKNIERLRIAGLKVIALPTAGGKPHRIQQQMADYNVTEKDIAKAARAARKRKASEKSRAARLTVRN